MKNYIYLLANGVQKLPGGNYTIDSILNIISKFTGWVLRVGIALAGLSLLVGFVMYAVVDVDQKPRVKQRIIQTLLGVAGIILAISLVNIIIELFK